MELKFLLMVIFSFVVTFCFAPFFIGLLFRFNIRRREGDTDLHVTLPGRRLVKMGTPIMGGALISFTLLLVLGLFLKKWDVMLPFALVIVLGSLFGAIDEALNALGRSGFRFAVRESVDSVVSKNAVTWKVYKIVLIPWNLFKEAFRAMGSSQHGLKSHHKFLMQVLVALVGGSWLYFVIGLHSVWLPFVGEISLGVFYLPFIMFLALGFADAFGVTDGMDGLSAGLHAIAFLPLGVMALALGELGAALFCAAIVGAELAFLYFNIPPARVQMSDVGTLPLGMLFAFLAIYLRREIVLPIIGGVFAMEILSSFLQVWSVKLRHKRIFLVAPIHHHFEKLGWPEYKITMRFWLIQAILSFLGLFVGLLR